MSTIDIIKWTYDKLASGLKVALVTIIGKEGSGPRDVGALMAVAEDGSKAGTIGGGEVEQMLIKEALRSISENQPIRLKLALRPDNIPADAVKTGMLCGGVIEVFINPLSPKPRLIIFGGGHVGKPVGDIGNMLGYNVVVLDKNPSLANNERFPYAKCIVTDDLPGEIDKLSLRDSDVVVITYGEPETDYQVLRKLVMIGFKGHVWALCSRRRASWMLNRLREEGFNLDSYKGRIHTPAGLDIGSDTPEEIAVSIWAEIICEMKKCSKPVSSLGLEY